MAAVTQLGRGVRAHHRRHGRHRRRHRADARDPAGALARLDRRAARRRAGSATSASIISTSPARSRPTPSTASPTTRAGPPSRWSTSASACCSAVVGRGGLHLHPVERRRLAHPRSGLRPARSPSPPTWCWLALAYGVIASGLMLWVGAPLGRLRRPQERGGGLLPLRHDARARQRRERGADERRALRAGGRWGASTTRWWRAGWRSCGSTAI